MIKSITLTSDYDKILLSSPNISNIFELILYNLVEEFDLDENVDNDFLSQSQHGILFFKDKSQFHYFLELKKTNETEGDQIIESFDEKIELVKKQIINSNNIQQILYLFEQFGNYSKTLIQRLISKSKINTFACGITDEIYDLSIISNYFVIVGNVLYYIDDAGKMNLIAKGRNVFNKNVSLEIYINKPQLVSVFLNSQIFKKGIEDLLNKFKLQKIVYKVGKNNKYERKFYHYVNRLQVYKIGKHFNYNKQINWEIKNNEIIFAVNNYNGSSIDSEYEKENLKIFEENNKLLKIIKKLGLFYLVYYNYLIFEGEDIPIKSNILLIMLLTIINKKDFINKCLKKLKQIKLEGNEEKIEKLMTSEEILALNIYKKILSLSSD